MTRHLVVTPKEIDIIETRIVCGLLLSPADFLLWLSLAIESDLEFWPITLLDINTRN